MSKTKQKHAPLHHVVILDRSGSMGNDGLWTEAVGSLATYVKEAKKRDFLTLTVFDNRIDELLKRVPVRDVDVLKTLAGVKPRGTTALRDAWGMTLSSVTAPQSEKVVVIVVTDGKENASREFGSGRLKTLIASRENEGWSHVFGSGRLKTLIASRENEGWSHVYLAANQAAEEVARQDFGLAPDQAATFSPSSGGIRSAFGGAKSASLGSKSWKSGVM